MGKYFRIAINTLQEYFAYRVNFAFWRFRVLLTFVIFFSLWSAVSAGKSGLGIYSRPDLYTYFLVGYFIQALVFTTRTADIGGDIQNGNLSSLLIKPLGPIKYYFSRDIIDKLFNSAFMVVEFGLILLIFRPQFTWPTPANFFYFTVFLLLSIITFFFYSLIISFTTFWSDQAWSSRFLFGVVFINLFSGQFVPLDFLPPWVSRLLDYTPFPYLYYYPVKVWLGQLNPELILWRLFTGLLICFFFATLAQLLWHRGKFKYQSYGN